MDAFRVKVERARVGLSATTVHAVIRLVDAREAVGCLQRDLHGPGVPAALKRVWQRGQSDRSRAVDLDSGGRRIRGVPCPVLDRLARRQVVALTAHRAVGRAASIEPGERIRARPRDEHIARVPAVPVRAGRRRPGQRRCGLVDVDPADAALLRVSGGVHSRSGGRLIRALVQHLVGRAFVHARQRVTAGEADRDVVVVPAVCVRRTVGLRGDRRVGLVERDAGGIMGAVARVVHCSTGHYLVSALGGHDLVGRAARDPGKRVVAVELDGHVAVVPAIQVRDRGQDMGDGRRRLVDVDGHAVVRLDVARLILAPELEGVLTLRRDLNAGARLLAAPVDHVVGGLNARQRVARVERHADVDVVPSLNRRGRSGRWRAIDRDARRAV